MNKNQKNKVTNKFLLLVATINSPDVISDDEMRLTKELIDSMLKDYTFLSEHEGIYYKNTPLGVQGGKYLMAEVHKMWDVTLDKKVFIDWNIYHSPKVFDYILRDKWTPQERWQMITSAIDFMLENKANEIESDTPQQHNAFVSLQEATDELRNTPGITNVLPRDFFWNRINAFLYYIQSNNFYTGTSPVETDVMLRMVNVIDLMSKTQSYANAFTPVEQTTAEKAVEEE